ADGYVYDRREERCNESHPEKHRLVESSGVFTHRSWVADVLSRRAMAQGGPHMEDPHGRHTEDQNPYPHHGDGDFRPRILEPGWENDLVRPADAARRGLLAGRIQRRDGRTYLVSPGTERMVDPLQCDAGPQVLLRRRRGRRAG